MDAESSPQLPVPNFQLPNTLLFKASILKQGLKPIIPKLRREKRCNQRKVLADESHGDFGGTSIDARGNRSKTIHPGSRVLL
jgi:hypothetical protein